MVVAVLGLGDVLAHEIVRQMAIGAGRGGVVGAAGPGGVLVVHDVAVGAGFRIRGEVARALRVAKREEAHAGHEPHDGCGDHGPAHRERVRAHGIRSLQRSRRRRPRPYGRIATLMTPSLREPKRSYASRMRSSLYSCVSNGVRSTRPRLTISMSRLMRSLPPGQRVVTISWSPRPAANASWGS